MARAKPRPILSNAPHRVCVPAPTNVRGSACACGGGCPRCQAKRSASLPISQPGDVAEREADRIADAVLRTPRVQATNGVANARIMRHPESNAGATPVVPETVGAALRETGRPLDAGTREFFEPRLGHDFSDVRVHTGARARESARALDAHAYTLGRDVVFGAGRYAPQSAAGRKLLAHELVHVAQQRAAPSAHLQRQSAGGGSSTFSEHVNTVTTNSGEPGVWSGRVTRRETNRAGSVIHTGEAPVRYDENSCRVTVPITVSFRHATLADLTTCPPHWNQPAPTSVPPHVSSTRLREIADQYVPALNQDLNGWYAVRLDGCEDNPCHGRDMPIEVQVTEVSAGTAADYDVAVANREGRSCVDDTNYKSGAGPGLVLLYATDLTRGTMSHEGGHMALGHGDEYRETERPSPSLEDRVREGDYSRMASHSSYGKYTLMHERHYAFVPAFLNKVRPGCRARLVELDRPLASDFTFSIHLGFAGFPVAGGTNKGFYLEYAADWGFPLNRTREWRALLGPHLRFLMDEDARAALEFGARFGIEHMLTSSSGRGFTSGAFGELGLAYFDPGGGWRSGVYGEAGAYVGYNKVRGSAVTLRLEGAIGEAWSAVGRIVGPDEMPPKTPENLEHFRLGIIIGGEF